MVARRPQQGLAAEAQIARLLYVGVRGGTGTLRTVRDMGRRDSCSPLVWCAYHLPVPL